MRFLKPITLSVGIVLLGGCVSLNSPVANKTSDTFHPETETTAIDTGGALTTLHSAGFEESDFGSPSAMRSAARMLSSLSAEWQAFDAWTKELFERQEELKDEIRSYDERNRTAYLVGGKRPDGGQGAAVLARSQFSETEEALIREHMLPVGCFDSSGSFRTYTEYADLALRRQATFANSPNLALSEWDKAQLDQGKKMSWDEFADWRVSKEPEDKLRVWRQAALREYGQNCTIGTPVHHAHYVLNVHFTDVKGSLFAAAVDRVGAHRALEMTTYAMRQQVGAMNEATKALWELSDSGKWRTPTAPLPAFVERAEGILPWHLGGMCSPFGAGPRNNDPVSVDEVAIALGFQPRPTDGGWHCLTWSDYNWQKVAELVEVESTLLMEYMSEYSVISNGYAVPGWAYPGPSQQDQQYYTRRRDLKRDSGMSSRSTIHERETCTTYAAKNSNLVTWSYPACNILEDLANGFDERAALMRSVGRADAFTCSRDLTGSSYAPDVSQCPSVHPRSSMERGSHKSSVL